MLFRRSKGQGGGSVKQFGRQGQDRGAAELLTEMATEAKRELPDALRSDHGIPALNELSKPSQ